MNYVTYCLIYIALALAMIGAGVWLVITEHYGWAWIPWLFIFCLSWKPPSADAASSPQGEKK